MNALAPPGLAVALVLLASARLDSAHWTMAPASTESRLSSDGTRMTTPLAKDPTDLVAKGTLVFDTANGREAELQFLTSESWVSCLAPGGLKADVSGQIAFECRAEASGLAALKRATFVKVKIDPPGGGQHQNLFWDFRP